VLEQAERNDLDSVPGLVRMISGASYFCALQAKDKDNRANVVAAMTRLAMLGYQDIEIKLLYVLSRESNTGVTEVSFPWIESRFHALKKPGQDIALLAIAKAPLESKRSFEPTFIATLPEPIRCRLTIGRDLDLASLSRKERLDIATSRIDKILESGEIFLLNYVSFLEEFGRLEEAALTFQMAGNQPKAASPELISDALDLIDRITNASAKYGYPLKAVASCNLITDHLLMPLAKCYADECHAERARKLFQEICSVLLVHEMRTQNTVAAYRGLLKVLEEGATFEEALGRFEDALNHACEVDYQEEMISVLKSPIWNAR
jgi:hypothetical protein